MWRREEEALLLSFCVCVCNESPTDAAAVVLLQRHLVTRAHAVTGWQWQDAGCTVATFAKALPESPPPPLLAVLVSRETGDKEATATANEVEREREQRRQRGKMQWNAQTHEHTSVHTHSRPTPVAPVTHAVYSARGSCMVRGLCTHARTRARAASGHERT